jgi:hypothetical protein
VEPDNPGLAGDAFAHDGTPRLRRRRGRPSRARGQPNSSDDAVGRWTIRGVPPHVRELAVRRATERGMTVGDWVAEAIVGFVRASDRAQGDRSNLPATEPPPDMTQLLQRLDERITRLEQRRTLGFFGRLFGRQATTRPDA